MTLSEVFQNISKVVCAQLNLQIKKNKDRIEKNNGTYREDEGLMPEGAHNELMTDFATEEFINKNIRIRP